MLGLLDWMGIVLSQCSDMSSVSLCFAIHLECFVSTELSKFAVSAAFDTVQADDSNSIEVVRSQGWISAATLCESVWQPRIPPRKLEFLNSQVQNGAYPFALAFVSGSRDCGGISLLCSSHRVVQWLVGNALSEFQFSLNDAAQYVVLLLPDRQRFVFLLAADCESRLSLVCSTNTRGVILAQMQRDLLLKLLDGLRLPLDPQQLLAPQDGLRLLAEQRLQELALVVQHLVLPGGLSVVQNPNLRLSGERDSDQLVRAI